MRCRVRNKKNFYYATRTLSNTVTDSFGNKKTVYSAPIAFSANIGIPSGGTIYEAFGSFESYDRIIVVEGVDCPITETCVLFIDVTPNGENFDYEVGRVAKSLNYTLIGANRVKIL